MLPQLHPIYSIMVWVNERKYACESCINGHRSSSCTHTLRPLFEVRSKGRPPSQCEECRDARKKNRRHVKCSCDGEEEYTSSLTPFDLIDPRYAPPKSHHRLRTNVPALPNGLRDLQNQPGISPPAHAKQQLQFLLNPADDYPSPTASSPVTSSQATSRSSSWDGLSATLYPSQSPPDSDRSFRTGAPSPTSPKDSSYFTSYGIPSQSRQYRPTA